MRVESETSTVGEYFNTKWQSGLIQFLGVSLVTTVQVLWVVDNPASSYQLQDIPCQLIKYPDVSNPATDYPIIIKWQWFSPTEDAVSKLRLDYHNDEDILYIINQEHRRQSLMVSDVLKPSATD